MARFTPKTKPELIRLIHVAKRELALDEETYRAALALAVPGKTSAKDMTTVELEKALEALKKKGFQIRRTAGSRPLADDAQSKKLRALWLEMAAQGIVKRAEESALAAYVKRLTGVDALQWLNTDQASRVIETLKKWQTRELKRTKDAA